VVAAGDDENDHLEDETFVHTILLLRHKVHGEMQGELKQNVIFFIFLNIDILVRQ